MTKIHNGQTFLFGEAVPELKRGALVFDYFAGAGGASTGIEQALGRSPDVAINHCANAVACHKLNHPNTDHYQVDVWDVDPKRHLPPGDVEMAWFSPACTHFSRANGGKPVNKKIRGLAWVVVRVARERKPRLIFLENVAEFATWGPLDADGMPVKAKAGQTFRAFVRKLEQLGYAVEHRVLNAADYGAPTLRKRLVMVARRDGKPIVWPDATHGDPKEIHGKQRADSYPRCDDRRSSGRRSIASKCGDRGGLCVAVENAKQAHRFPEQARILADDHHHEWQGHHVDGSPDRLGGRQRSAAQGDGGQPRGRGEEQQPNQEPHVGKRQGKQRTRQKDGSLEAKVLHGQRSDESDGCSGCASTFASSAGCAQSGRCERVGHKPGSCASHHARSSPKLLPYVTAASCIDWTIPVPSIFDRPRPLADATCKRLADGIMRYVVNAQRPFIVPVKTHGGGGNGPSDIDAPLRTITASKRGEFALVSVWLAKHYGGVVGHDVNRPLGTITTVDHHSVVACHLTKFYGTSVGAGVDAPAPTITGQGQHIGLVAAFLTKYYSSSNNGQPLTEPMHTVVTKDRFGLVTVLIDGETYAIADIGLRMLTPRELARAQGFEDSFQLVGTQTEQVARIGNSVSPPMARAVVAANI